MRIVGVNRRRWPEWPAPAPALDYFQRAQRPSLEVEGVDRKRANAGGRDAQAAQERLIGAPQRMDHHQPPDHTLLSIGLDQARQTHGPDPLGPPELRRIEATASASACAFPSQPFSSG
jgi:hypothetical protein